MFKTLKYSAIIFVTLLWVAQVSFATTTWIDNVANDHTLNQGQPNYFFIYDITGSGDPSNVLFDPSNPFHPGSDVITGADLSLTFHFGNDGQNTKTANLFLDVNLQTLLNFTIADKDLTLNADAIAQLNDNGTLRLDIHRISGTFQLTDSKLTANGVDNTVTQPNLPAQPSVPEPSTFYLLGAGLLGVGFVRMRLKR
jgi:hypothetical protein